VLAVVVAAVVLGQRPSALSALGILLVAAAGIGATRQHQPERQRHEIDTS
jgi:threonine/homoserine efflux transporter RhtA